MSGVKERLIQFIEYKGISKYSFEKQCGLSKRYVSNMRSSLQPDKLESISIVFPELNFDWLLLGRGDMLLKNSTDSSGGDKFRSNQNNEVEELRDKISLLKEVNALLREKIAMLEGEKDNMEGDRLVSMAAETMTYNKK